MTKGDLIKKLQEMVDVPDDTIIIVPGGNMETGVIMETLTYVVGPEAWEERESTFRDAFDNTRYTHKYWGGVRDEKNAKKVIRIG